MIARADSCHATTSPDTTAATTALLGLSQPRPNIDLLLSASAAQYPYTMAPCNGIAPSLITSPDIYGPTSRPSWCAVQQRRSTYPCAMGPPPILLSAPRPCMAPAPAPLWGVNGQINITGAVDAWPLPLAAGPNVQLPGSMGRMSPSGMLLGSMAAATAPGEMGLPSHS
jgi:hypothetical protein